MIRVIDKNGLKNVSIFKNTCGSVHKYSYSNRLGHGEELLGKCFDMVLRIIEKVVLVFNPVLYKFDFSCA